MDYAKTININCKAEVLETYFFKMMFKDGNNDFAEAMGIHPSAASREKARVFKLACKAIARYGLPADAVTMPEQSATVVIEGDYAERLLQAIECSGKIKRKTPSAGTAEASNQIELTI